MIFIYYHTKRKMHKEFAEIYDVFMKHVDYNDWYKFLKNYLKRTKNLYFSLNLKSYIFTKSDRF